MKIFFIGGHLTPALAIIQEIQQSAPENELYYLGQKYTNYRKSEFAHEYLQLSKLSVIFLEFRSGRKSNEGFFRQLIEIYLLIEGLVKSLWYINKYLPDKIVLFGGFLAIPFGIWGKIFSIPTIMHEQTLVPGSSNRFLARFVSRILVSFPSSVRYFPSNKTEVVGCPIRKSLFLKQKKLFLLNKSLKKVLILGGSTGSHVINIAIEKCLNQLQKNYQIFHQTGNNQQFGDFARLNKLASDNYIVSEHFNESQLAYLYQHIDLLVSRSGANTFFEIVHFSLPSVLVPLQIASFGEQQAQAALLQDEGVSIMLEEKNLPSVILPAMEKMLSRDRNKMVFPSFPQNDAVIAKIITNILDK